MTASIYTLPAKKIGVSTAAATVTLFTVSGGTVLILGLFGKVTTAVGAGAVLATFNSNPSSGADSPLSIASPSLALAPIGSLLSITGNVAAAPALSAGSGALAGLSIPLIVNPGTIEVTFAVGDATGVFDFYCNWTQMDLGSVVS
jgi:hypothetical protein